VPATETESLDLFGLSRFLQRRGRRSRALRECTGPIDWAAGRSFVRRAAPADRAALMAQAPREHARAAEIWLKWLPIARTDSCLRQWPFTTNVTPKTGQSGSIAKLAVATLRRQGANSRDPFLTGGVARLRKVSAGVRRWRKITAAFWHRPRTSKVIASPKANQGLVKAVKMLRFVPSMVTHSFPNNPGIRRHSESRQKKSSDGRSNSSARISFRALNICPREIARAWSSLSR